MAADVSFDKRQDKWQTYAMTAKNFAPALYNTANVTQATSNATGVTVNANTGVITLFGTVAGSGNAIFSVTNSAVTTNSKIFLTLTHTAGATAVVAQLSPVSINNGSFTIQFVNGSANAITAPKIHFMIIE